MKASDLGLYKVCLDLDVSLGNPNTVVFAGILIAKLPVSVRVTDNGVTGVP